MSRITPTRARKLVFKDPEKKDLQKDLNAAQAAYLADTGQTKFANTAQFMRMYLLLGAFATSYAVLVFFTDTLWLSVVMAMLIAASMAGIGFAIQHDANHGALSPKKWVNRIWSLALDMIGGNSYQWRIKHNVVHHTYTNVAHDMGDQDIQLPFVARFSPNQPRRWFHRFQHWYIWILYGFLVPKWQLFDDPINFFRGKIGKRTFTRQRGVELAILIGGKTFFLSIAFIIPCLFHPVWMVVVFYLSIAGLMGIILATVFQLAHVVEETEYTTPEENLDIMVAWAKNQIITTANFSKENPILRWYLGGLNFQIEHHLYPDMAHCHYPGIAPYVQAVCERHGLPYNSGKSFFQGVASHVRKLKQLGRPDRTAA